MKQIAIAFATVLAVPLLAFGLSFVANDTALAQDLSTGLQASKGTGSAEELDLEGEDGLAKTIVNFMLWLVVILCVIMLIFGGIKYATSAGDTNKVQSAKNTIMYAVVGLIVAIFAWAIASWLVDQFGS